jgi:transposase-like protein
MSDHSLFKWRHFEADIILCAMRWYLRYALSYRDVEELLQERGVQVDHTTVFRWVQRVALIFHRRAVLSEIAVPAVRLCVVGLQVQGARVRIGAG